MEYVIDKKESDRIRVLRIICAIFVVILHTGTATAIYDNPPSFLVSIRTVFYICFGRAAVPIFFIISAILLYRKKYNYFENLKKKSISLLVPYFIINTIWIIFYFLISKSPVLSSYFAEVSLIKNINFNVLLSKFGFASNPRSVLGFSPNPICGQLWFIRDLFILNALAPIIKKIIDRFPYIIFLLLAIWLFIPTEPTDIYIYIYIYIYISYILFLASTCILVYRILFCKIQYSF